MIIKFLFIGFLLYYTALLTIRLLAFFYKHF